MTVDKYQKYQEKVEASAKMLCHLKQRYQLNKWYDDMTIPAMEEVLHVSSYPLLEYIGFHTDISDGFKTNEGSHYFFERLYASINALKIR